MYNSASRSYYSFLCYFLPSDNCRLCPTISSKTFTRRAFVVAHLDIKVACMVGCIGASLHRCMFAANKKRDQGRGVHMSVKYLLNQAARGCRICFFCGDLWCVPVQYIPSVVVSAGPPTLPLMLPFRRTSLSDWRILLLSMVVVRCGMVSGRVAYTRGQAGASIR